MKRYTFSSISTDTMNSIIRYSSIKRCYHLCIVTATTALTGTVSSSSCNYGRLRAKQLCMITASTAADNSGIRSNVYYSIIRNSLDHTHISNVVYYSLPKEERYRILSQVASAYSNSTSKQLHTSMYHFLTNTDDGLRIAMKMRDDVVAMKRQNKSALSKKIPADSAVTSISIPVEGFIDTMNGTLKQFLQGYLSYGATSVNRLTFEHSSGSMLEKIAEGEMVHRVRSLGDLKARLSHGRRCYGLFHSSFQDPLALLHIALTETIAGDLKSIHAIKEEPTMPTTAMFYSVSSPYTSLKGLDLGERIIKTSVNILKQEYPSIHQFSTLSPVPDFLKWYKQLVITTASTVPVSTAATMSTTVYTTGAEIGNRLKLPQHCKEDLYTLYPKLQDRSDIEILQFMYETLFASINNATPTATATATTDSSNDDSSHHQGKYIVTWCNDSDVTDCIKSTLMYMMAYYLCCAKLSNTKGGGVTVKAYDPVQRFHLKNGAELHCIHWLSNTSMSGLSTSASMMVNYKYNCEDMESNATMYEITNGAQLHIHENVKKYLC